MVYDHTAIEFTYPSPDRPSPPIPNNKTVPQKQKTPKSKSQQTPRHTSNQKGHDINSTIKLQSSNGRPKGQYATPPYQPPTQPNSSFAVVIPKPPETFRREEYASSQPKVESPVESPSRAALEVHVPVQRAILPSTKPYQPHQQHAFHGPSQSPVQVPTPSQGLAVIIPDLPPTFRPEEY